MFDEYISEIDSVFDKLKSGRDRGETV
jgi:hypothetical protein